MADAYKLKADASFPKALRKVEELIDGQEVYETTGVNYVAGGYVLASDLTPRDRERAEKGELDHLLEGVSKEEAEQALEVNEKGVFIPEHEAERVVLEDYGHEIVPRDQVLELKSAGAEEAKAVLEAAKEDGADERPALTAAEVPSLVEVSNDTEGGVNNVPAESEPVDEEKLEGVEQPPGLPVGEDKKALEADPAEPPKRGRPKKQEATKESQEQAKAQQEKKD